MRNLVSRVLYFLILSAAGLATGRAADAPASDDFSGELPRIAPTEPADALSTFRVAPGFRLELVAAEPLVRDPVALAFDERARLFVVEMCDYSEQDKDFLGNVRLLEDADGDGIFDRSTVYADKLSWPTALCCFDGGVFVGAAPDIWYLKDTNSDGVADERRRVFTGFGRDNVQGLLNSFQWGLDNRIHGATSSSGGEVRRADQPDAKPVSLRGRDFSFDPRTLDLRPESGGAQHGMSFDDWGRKFVCSNSDHIQLVMFADRYLARNPLLAAPSPRLSIAEDGPQAEVHRISPVEPWRVVRTRLRVAGAVPGPVEGGGRAAGYFTSATGVTIYRGDAWPEEFRGNAIVGDVGSNIVHRKRLEPFGIELIARRIDKDSELVASKDIWFRPAQFANGPDGNLYISDVYREVIEHPASLPPVIKRHLDLTSGRNRGRIYRVAAEGSQSRAAGALSAMNIEGLVAALAEANGWKRDTAARLLYERQDPAAVEPLMKLAGGAESPLARMHALHALAGLNGLTPEILLARFADKHPRVREHAILLSESFLHDSRIAERLAALATDPDPLVRYQLAFTLGELPPEVRDPALKVLALADGDDRWMSLAIRSSLAAGAASFLVDLIPDATPQSLPLLESLAGQVGRTGNSTDIEHVLRALPSDLNVKQHGAVAVLRALSSGYSAEKLQALLADRGLDAVTQRIATLLTDARRVAFDSTASDSERVQALVAFELASEDESAGLIELVQPREPLTVQLAAIGQLRRSTRPEIATELLEAWPALAPALRGPALEILFSRSDRLPEVLAALESGRMNVRDLDAARRKQLTGQADPDVRARAERVFASAGNSDRSAVVESYREALNAAGDVEAGRQVFLKVCAACHKLQGAGHEIGPNLASLRNRGPETILVNVLDPNREVNPQFVNYLAVTTEGLTLTGMIAAETANSLTLQRAENQRDTVLRGELESLESTGASLMPEGLEKDVSVKAMADLIAYLLSVK